MSIVESQLVKIEIAPKADSGKSILRLDYQGQLYDLVQVFVSQKLHTPAAKLRERAEQKLQQLIETHRAKVQTLPANRYLLVREVGYYSLWELARSIPLTPKLVAKSRQELALEGDLELQQASILLFQELWLQLADLLGSQQLPLLAEYLLAANPQFHTWAEIEQLLNLDPLTADKLGIWAKTDSIVFVSQIYQLVQKKLGKQFGIQLTIEILQTMPDGWRSRLEQILKLEFAVDL